MSSQTEMTQQSATPCNYEYCLIGPDGLVTALVEWRRDDKGRMYAIGYGLSDEAISDLPMGAYCVNEIDQLVRERRLIDLFELLIDKGRCLRVDDNRFGRNLYYFVWTGKARQWKPSFAPNAVYHRFDSRQEACGSQELSNFDEVMELVHDPDAVFITNLDNELSGANFDTPAMMSKFGDLKDRLVVWDRTSIARTALSKEA